MTPKPIPLRGKIHLWKFIEAGARAQFLAVALGETEEAARARLLAYGQAEIIRENEEALARGEPDAEEIGDEELEARMRELKAILDVCVVTRMPSDMPGVVCWAEFSF